MRQIAKPDTEEERAQELKAKLRALKCADRPKPDQEPDICGGIIGPMEKDDASQ